MHKNADFTKGPIIGPLIRFSLPILLALFLQALYGAVDLMVVGQYARAEDVSGVAVGSQIMTTITNLISSFAMGSTILLGLKTAIGISMVLGVAMFWLSFFHGDILCRIFSNDDAVVAAGFDYLRAYGIDCLMTCFLFCFIGFFNGLGKTAFVMAQGIAAAFVVRIPIAYVMSKVMKRLFFIGLCIPCSTLVQIIVFFVYYRRMMRQSKAEE